MESVDLLVEGIVEREKEAASWVSALEAAMALKDPDLRARGRRIGGMARRLALAVGLPEAEAELIATGARLHDLGMLAIPDSIRYKPTTLSDDEKEILRHHPQWSSIALAEVVPGSPLIPLVLHHHERWDGRGYPNGLSGEAIPLGARILKLADVYDAVTSPRLWRPALTGEQALSLIEAGAGTEFDPGLVPSFVSLQLQS